MYVYIIWTLRKSCMHAKNIQRPINGPSCSRHHLVFSLLPVVLFCHESRFNFCFLLRFRGQSRQLVARIKSHSCGAEQSRKSSILRRGRSYVWAAKRKIPNLLGSPLLILLDQETACPPPPKNFFLICYTVFVQYQTHSPSKCFFYALSTAFHTWHSTILVQPLPILYPQVLLKWPKYTAQPQRPSVAHWGSTQQTRTNQLASVHTARWANSFVRIL